MWAAKNSLVPRHTQHIPIAVKDMKGNLITSSAGIKDFSLNKIIKRLRHRRIHPDIIQLQELKE